MKKLLYTTTAFVLCGSIVQANAACIKTPDCQTLGYTSSTACDGGLKCPFGNYWNCSNFTNEIKLLCESAGYTYFCTETNETGGKGQNCNGKFNACNCAIGYVFVDGSCVRPWKKCTGIAVNCSIGDILFSDGTCNANTVSGKTPIAVVVYKSGNCGQAMALKSVGNYEWAGGNTDISGLTNYSSTSAATKDYDSCGNTAKIIAAGNKSTYPAAWAAHEYKIERTEAGDWCLPAAGIFTSIYSNKSTINTGFSRAGGTQFTTSTYAWSSSESYGGNAWYSDFSYSGNDGLSDHGGKNRSYAVYPVIEF